MVQNLVSKGSAMSFTFKVETWLKVTAYPLPTITINLKYEQDRARGGYGLKEIFIVDCYDLDFRNF